VKYSARAQIVDGKLKLESPVGFADAMRRRKDGPVTVTIADLKSQRSLDQNAYLHAAVFPPIAEHCGYSIPECKLVLMGECWGWKHDTLSGRDLPIKPSTSEMTVEDATYFIDWVIPWAATELGVVVELPNEHFEAAS
jgi:hypothetical protein